MTQPSTEQAFLATPFQGAGSNAIASPFQFVADNDTFFRVTSACSVANVSIAVQGRRLDLNGHLQAIREVHVPFTDRSVKTQDLNFGPGAILNVTVFALTGSPFSGQCYVVIQIMRNFGGAAIVLGTLLGGYVTRTQALGFPGSPIVSSTEGEPAIRNIIGTLPALGANIGENAPSGARWELISVETRLTTDGGAGNRSISMRIFKGSGETMSRTFPNSGAAQAPSTTTDYTFGQNIPLNDFTLGVCQIPLIQRQFLTASDQFVVTGQQGGDQYTAPNYQVREWLEVA